MLGKITPAGPYILRWFRTALAGYLVVGSFGAGYLVTNAIDDSNANVAIVVGLLISGPLALAFLWDRLKTVKAFGVEVGLDSATVPVDSELAVALSAEQSFNGWFSTVKD